MGVSSWHALVQINIYNNTGTPKNLLHIWRHCAFVVFNMTRYFMALLPTVPSIHI